MGKKGSAPNNSMIWISSLTILDSCDLIGLGIRNLNSEFLFNGHDNLDSVKRVKAEIAGE